LGVSVFAVLLAAGLVWALAATKPSEVNPGYLRSTLLVVLGLLVLAVLSGWSEWSIASKGLAIASCVGTYVAFFAWQIERETAARGLVWGLAAILGGLILVTAGGGKAANGWAIANAMAAAGLLGVSMGAMLLGHYYLTAPWMSLTPLRRLIIGIFLAGGLRAMVTGAAVAVYLQSPPENSYLSGPADWGLYVMLRWVMGIGGPIVLSVLVWKTIQLKATQAATGILYVVVLLVLIGEATGVALDRLAGAPL
jgi:hypothetical protein